MKIFLIIWLLLQVPMGVLAGKCLKERNDGEEIGCAISEVGRQEV